MLKNQKGITLIALVITIIVLLILAGVSIAMLTGKNGILTQANNAKTETSKAEVKEKINMVLNGEYTSLVATGLLTGETSGTWAATTQDKIRQEYGLDTNYTIAPRSTQDAATALSVTAGGKTGTITYAGGKYTINAVQ